MGILDQVLGAIGGSSGSGSPMQGILMSLLSGTQGNSQQTGQFGNATGGGSGLGHLVSSLEGAGLGNIVQSWIGNGANQSISPDQLHSALGDQQVQSMAAQSGMAPHDLLSQLAQHLPGLVDQMTPNGRPPNGDDQSGVINV